VLQYRVPPARAVDVGCAHGGFVMLLRRAGYDAMGLELSPWVVDFARSTFGVPVLVGTLEAQALAPGSLDVVTLFDVVEHLADPPATLGAAAAALAEDGVLVIQTPSVPRDVSWERMVATDHPFLPLMRERGHLYLFTEEGLRRLLVDRLGIEHVSFEPPYFGAYDMFVVASRRPVVAAKSSAVAEALGASPDGRLVQALLDLDDRLSALQQRYADVERDRAARLVALQDQGGRLMGAEGRLNALRLEAAALRSALATAEADRADRLTIIQDLGERLAAAETDRAARLAVIEDFAMRLDAADADRAARLAVIEDLVARLSVAEEDRAARLTVIHDLAGRLEAADADRAARLAAIEDLGTRLDAAEADRAARLAVIHETGARVGALEAELAERLRIVEEQAAHLRALEAELASLRFRRARVAVRGLARRVRAVFRP
jgi:hypothetical protein